MSAAPQSQEAGHLPRELALVLGRTKTIPRQELGSGLPNRAAVAKSIRLLTSREQGFVCGLVRA
jgi:hypothetical protein